MKVIKTVYLDHQSSFLEEQLKIAYNCKLPYISLRMIDNRRLIDLNKVECKKIENETNKAGIKNSNIDFITDDFNVNNSEKKSEYLLQFKKITDFANKLKVSYIHISLPQFDSIDKDQHVIISLLNECLKIIHRKDITLILKMTNKSSIYHRIFKILNNKQLKLSFDPLYLYQNNESITTIYRLLKGYIGNVCIRDINEYNEPTMIGYGTLKLIEIFKKMIRDDFNGSVVLDTNLLSMKNIEEKPLKGLKRFINDVKIILHNKGSINLEQIKRRISPNKEEVTYTDIICNQMDVLNKVFISQ